MRWRATSLSGALQPGQRLPPHRELAFSLGVAIATVTKAYAEARLYGLVRSLVGSGTFVIEPVLSERRRIRPNEMTGGADSRIDLSANTPITTLGQAAALADTLQRLGTDRTATRLLDYSRPLAGLTRYRRAGAAWLASLGCLVDAEDVTVTCGAQHAASVVMHSMLRAGDVLLTDELTDPLAKLLANALGLELRGVPSDDDGMCVDAVETLCRRSRVRGLLSMPDHHSPTLAVMPEGRRRALAELARRHDLIVLEHGVYRPLVPDAPPCLSSFAPERSFFVSSFAKIIMPGLRIGFPCSSLGSRTRSDQGVGRYQLDDGAAAGRNRLDLDRDGPCQSFRRRATERTATTEYTGAAASGRI